MSQPLSGAACHHTTGDSGGSGLPLAKAVVNYRVRQPGRRKPTQIYHVNLLKMLRHTGGIPARPDYEEPPGQGEVGTRGYPGFKTFRQALCQEPILITPDFNPPFVVHTDASDVGLGAVLSQDQGNEDHPVVFASRKLLSHEKAYSTIEKEAPAIKWALGHFRYFLLGPKFRLVTDHAPLKWLSTALVRNKLYVVSYLLYGPRFEI